MPAVNVGEWTEVRQSSPKTSFEFWTLGVDGLYTPVEPAVLLAH